MQMRVEHANRVDLEKCCSRSMLVQNSTSIQPRTDLPKIGKLSNQPPRPSHTHTPLSQKSIYENYEEVQDVPPVAQVRFRPEDEAQRDDLHHALHDEDDREDLVREREAHVEVLCWV